MGHVVNTHMVDVSPEHLAPQRAVLRGKAGGFGRDFGGRVESWRGEGGEAANDRAVVKACPGGEEAGKVHAAGADSRAGGGCEAAGGFAHWHARFWGSGGELKGRRG